MQNLDYCKNVGSTFVAVVHLGTLFINICQGKVFVFEVQLDNRAFSRPYKLSPLSVFLNYNRNDFAWGTFPCI